MSGPETFRTVLVAIDDDPISLELVVAVLQQDGLEIVTASDPRQGLELIAKIRPQIVVSDLMMPGLTGMEVLERTLHFDPSIEVVLLTAHYSAEAAVEAIQKGASDYINKPIETRKLRERVNRIIARVRRHYSARNLELELLRAHRFRGMVGRSPLMLDLFARIERIAPHYRTILVTGPTGTGKELVARALHETSPVSEGPFIVCNCAAIPEHLVESELFGHVRGSFTGATQDKGGLFEAAHHGTILLDEIGDMSLPAQAKLLRVIQHQEVQRVGASVGRKVSVRVVAATHRDLRTMVADKTFREDLFFRIGMVELRLPTLRDRKEDLPLLLRHFLDSFADSYGKPFEGFTRKAETALLAYHWPGNVRELEGVIGAVAMLAEPPLIDVGDLPAHMLAHGQPVSGISEPVSGVSEDVDLTLDEIQVAHAHRVMAHVGGDKTKAAEILGVSRATLYRLLSRAQRSTRRSTATVSQE